MSDDSEDYAPKRSTPKISRREIFEKATILAAGAYFGAITGGSSEFVKNAWQKDIGQNVHGTGPDAEDIHASVDDTIENLKEGAGVGAVAGAILSAVMHAHRAAGAAIHPKETAAATISEDTSNGKFQKKETARKERIHTKFDGLP